MNKSSKNKHIGREQSNGYRRQGVSGEGEMGKRMNCVVMERS